MNTKYDKYPNLRNVTNYDKKLNIDYIFRRGNRRYITIIESSPGRHTAIGSNLLYRNAVASEDFTACQEIIRDLGPSGIIGWYQQQIKLHPDIQTAHTIEEEIAIKIDERDIQYFVIPYNPDPIYLSKVYTLAETQMKSSRRLSYPFMRRDEAINLGNRNILSVFETVMSS
jgi:hypothetical protein